MALIFMDGFDKYGPVNTGKNTSSFQSQTILGPLLTAGEWTSTAFDSSNSGATYTYIDSPLSSHGQSLRMVMERAYNDGRYMLLFKTLPTNSRAIGGVRIKDNFLDPGIIRSITFTDGGQINTVHQVSITLDPGTGKFSIHTGTVVGTVLATSTVSISANTAHYLEWDITIGASAAYNVYLDGVSIISGTGNTKGGTANSQYNGFGFTASTQTNVALPAALWIDDLYINDTSGSTNNTVLLTNPRIETQIPSGDSAVQFSIGAATIGDSTNFTVSSTNDLYGSIVNTLWLRSFTPTFNCTLNSIAVLPITSSSPTKFKAVLYADSVNAPAALLATGTETTGASANNYLTLPFGSGQALTAGTQYWLGFIVDSNVALQGLDDGPAGGRRVNNTYGSGPPNPAGVMSFSPSVFMWGNVTGFTGNFNAETRSPPMPPNSAGDISYVSDSVVGHEDLYTFPNLSTTPTTVHAVAVKGLISDSDGGARTISLRTKSSATDSAGTGGSISPATSYAWLTSLFETNPNGSITWTGTTVNAATHGVKIDS